MEDFVRIFQTSTGDVYHITLSEGHSVLSAEAIDALKDVSIVGIELRRLAGRNDVTDLSPDILCPPVLFERSDLSVSSVLSV